MELFEHFFVFPIILIDGDIEEKKKSIYESRNNNAKIDADMIRSEAEVPYYDLASIYQAYLLTNESLDNALEGRFDACYVNFGRHGQYLVPWTKEKFKARYKKFVDNLHEKGLERKRLPEIRLIPIAREDMDKEGKVDE